jgi:hypothetical protein
LPWRIASALNCATLPRHPVSSDSRHSWRGPLPCRSITPTASSSRNAVEMCDCAISSSAPSSAWLIMRHSRQSRMSGSVRNSRSAVAVRMRRARARIAGVLMMQNGQG